ncbi:MAG: ABC transporter permease [Chloroflexi bacterium]|nr:ABC transporter permease [Chloroflexota bacterium]
MSESSYEQRQAPVGLATAVSIDQESKLDARVRTDSPWVVTRRRFLRHRAAIVSLVLLVAIVATMYGSALWIPADAARTGVDLNNINAPPSLEHPMGTDQAGADVLVRILLGGRVSLTVGFLAMALAMTLGTLVGAFSGYYGGWVDSVLMRLTDTMLAMPLLMVVVVLAAVLRGTFDTVMVIIIVIGITTWMTVARIVRANFLSLRHKEFVEAARCIGADDRRLIFRHVLPNTIAPIIVAATLEVANAILLEAYVSFLGVGIQPPTPSWGNMISGAQEVLYRAPWLALFPGLMITLTVLSINFIGDGLRDALDPHRTL